MSKSLAELRGSKQIGLPEQVYRICLSQKLVAEGRALSEELEELLVASAAEKEEGKPRRQGEKANPRIEEINKRLEAIYAEMEEHTGEIRLRAIQGGEWRRWVEKHPAREVGRDDQGRPIYDPIDEVVTRGYCSATALYESLETFFAGWNGDEPGPGDWEFIAQNAAPGDLNEICRIVVGLHELNGFRAPFSSRRSSTTQPDASASN